ncbi:MAG: Coenzyme F420 hydrogenase/dehydrogenase, beta subunit C-terminal domain [Chloroflexi bacterium]|nr:Coenzyme F420 hydrogenase/dehydrogenase, beta subunit C-terminal domain [Chloroflexota bacterium]
MEVKDGEIEASINLFLQKMLEEKLVDAVLVPAELPNKSDIAPTLITEPGILAQARPLAPVMPVSMARVVSRLTRVAPSQRKIAVLLRPCDLRSLVELVKLKQASLDNLLLISLDCYGTYSPADYREFCQDTPNPTDEFLRRVKDGDELNLREACQVCEYFVPQNADLVIGLLGVDVEKGVLLQAMTAQGEDVLAKLNLPGAEAEDRGAAIASLLAHRVESKERLFERVKKEMSGRDNLLDIFAACTSCYNCVEACPVCYCKECFLKSPAFEWEAEKYLDMAEKKGALRMPADTLLFHLTRLNHVGLSCTGCGLCQDACPSGIPLLPLFRHTGDEVQALFDYVPGRDLEEEPPLTMFDENELSWVG